MHSVGAATIRGAPAGQTMSACVTQHDNWQIADLIACVFAVIPAK
jgi:hypothetical protein